MPRETNMEGWTMSRSHSSVILDMSCCERPCQQEEESSVTTDAWMDMAMLCSEAGASRAWYQHCRKWPVLGGGCELLADHLPQFSYHALEAPASLQFAIDWVISSTQYSVLRFCVRNVIWSHQTSRILNSHRRSWKILEIDETAMNVYQSFSSLQWNKHVHFQSKAGCSPPFMHQRYAASRLG